MAKIISLSKRQKNKEDKEKQLETHPNNQKYWNNVISGLEKLLLTPTQNER